MARRVSWTNNSSGHLGTYVYRAPTLDPQTLPAPVATVDPVAQGATAEWIDTEELSPGDYEYAVRDYDGSGEGVLSGVVAHSISEDYSSAQVGDEIGGGIYAGIITYADNRQYHLIAALAADEAKKQFSGSYTMYGLTDEDDGLKNQEDALSLYDDGTLSAFYYCDNLTAGQKSDWYLPAANELRLLYENLGDHPEFADSKESLENTYSSTEVNIYRVVAIQFYLGDEFAGNNKTFSNRVRAIRRVAV